MVARIRQLLESKELTPTQFADLIGVGRPVVSHIMSERNKPSLEVVQRISDAFPDISLPWLLKGTGTMLEEEESEAPAQPLTHGNDATPVVTPLPPTPVVATAATSTPPETVPPAAISVGIPPVAAAKAVAVAAPVPAAAVPSSAAPVALRPFRASRFVPGPVAAPTPPPLAEPQAAPLPFQAATQSVMPALETVPTAPATVAPAASLPPPSAPIESALPAFLAEPGKAIRRIVIFYRDGSFADYQPE